MRMTKFDCIYREDVTIGHGLESFSIGGEAWCRQERRRTIHWWLHTNTRVSYRNKKHWEYYKTKWTTRGKLTKPKRHMRAKLVQKTSREAGTGT